MDLSVGAHFSALLLKCLNDPHRFLTQTQYLLSQINPGHGSEVCKSQGLLPVCSLDVLILFYESERAMEVIWSVCN